MWEPKREADLKGLIYHIIVSIIERRTNQLEVHLEYSVYPKFKTSMRIRKTRKLKINGVEYMMQPNEYKAVDRRGREHIIRNLPDRYADLLVQKANRNLFVLEAKM